MFEDWWGLVWRDRLAPNPEEMREVRANAGLSGGALFSTGLIGIASQAFHQISAQRRPSPGASATRCCGPRSRPTRGAGATTPR